MATYKPLRIGDATRGETTPIRTFAEGDTIDPAFLPGGGGAASIVEITYADMATALAGATLTPGQYYNITDAAGTDLGFVCLAVQADEITVSGIGGFTLTGGNEWDVCEFDFANNQLIYRSDLRGNIVRGADGVAQFPWGNDNVTGNFVLNGIINLTINAAATYANNAVYPGATISDITAGDGTAIENNILENGSQLTGITAGANCQISRNKVGQGATLGNSTMGDSSEIVSNDIGAQSFMQGNTIGSGSSINSNTLSSGCGIENNIIQDGSAIVFNTLTSGTAISSNDINGEISNNYLFSFGVIFEITTGSVCGIIKNTVGAGALLGTNLILSDNCTIENNILENGAQLTGITAGANCSISRNKVGQGATLGGSTTMGDGAAITDNTLANGYSLDTITLAAAETIDSLNYGQITAIDETTRDGLIIPQQGLVILNTTSGKLNFYTGSAWEEITSA